MILIYIINHNKLNNNYNRTLKNYKKILKKLAKK